VLTYDKRFDNLRVYQKTKRNGAKILGLQTALPFNEIVEKVKQTHEIIVEGKTYFTVENEEGFRAYVQVNLFGGRVDNPNYYQNLSFSTVHKPNHKTGGGYQFRTIDPTSTIEQILKAIDETLVQSKSNIQSGKEKFLKDNKSKN
jgi:hypothetical protein